ncbi:MAG: hypothetical protein H6765_07200 [Candidatus Peribacteria bacterium]|nr:MAG: hypothetical protein H6765_07200 [Candidatus Peribacteria bacterium]
MQFAIVDEQHKFGVKQRAFFHQFNAPHLLQMTATPIPRSLALAYFGEFQVSNIDEMPAGRKPITTKIINNTELTKLKPRILTKISQDQRVFLVTPLIEESEFLEEIASVTQMYDEICHQYPELAGKVGLLHGKMKSDEKQDIMQAFKDGKIVFLISTTVIEVGIDIPNATIMIIKNSERFGLSQLHQLRGRVGRSDLQSYCFLHTKSKSGDSYARLQHLENTNDGFKLSEIDLELRGSGEMLGVRQAGMTDIPLSILSDTQFLEKVQQAAIRLLEHHEAHVRANFLDSELQAKMDGMLV